MAVKATTSITVSFERDIISVTWYYKLQASTASPPAKPTTATPSGWTTTEPTYTEGSTNSLYVCQKTTFSDGTFEYSDVSLSSSYEAAKTAYNKGVAALTAANGKNKFFYLPSNTAPTDPSAGDQWFKTDKGNELWKYNGSQWEKVGLSSAVFSTVEVGNAIIGKLDSLLIYKDDDNYWNLSSANFDSSFQPTNIAANIAYKANTLKTNHLVALEDVYVDGGANSYLRIKTYNEYSDFEISNTGISIHNQSSPSTPRHTIEFPSGASSHSAYIIYATSDSLTDQYLLTMKGNHLAMVSSSYDANGNLEYNGTIDLSTYSLNGGVWVNPNNNFQFDFNYLKNRITLGKHSIVEADYTVNASKTRLYLNSNEITGIGDAYPTDPKCYGATAVWHDTGFKTYMSLAYNPSNNRLYVFASDDPTNVGYVGSVRLE